MAPPADHAHQPLRAQRDGPAGTQLPHQEHGSVPVQEGRGGRGGHVQAGHHLMVTTARHRSRRALTAGAAALVALGMLGACATARGSMASPRATGTAADQAWADSVLATLSLRDKAAQMVWPWLLGDYTPNDDPAFERIAGLVRDQHLGGLIISVGSPTEIAAKLNALQRVSRLPLLVGADLETGAAFRARGGFFLPNGIDLGGATAFPYEMGIGATRDSALAYQM